MSIDTWTFIDKTRKPEPSNGDGFHIFHGENPQLANGNPPTPENIAQEFLDHHPNYEDEYPIFIVDSADRVVAVDTGLFVTSLENWKLLMKELPETAQDVV